jgi:GMP synthase-like glutamine amidotransferase
MPRVLAFRHVPFEGLGWIEQALRAHAIDFDYADLYAQPAPPAEPADYDGLIFLGGPMSVNDGLPYLRSEEAYIRQAIGCGIPVLGVCLGSQLIARALGAQVRRNPVKEIGWFDICLTPSGRSDPLFETFAGSETVFHWHSETFELPPGAELLASSERCRNQAFRIGATVYGLQFHLEVTPAMIAGWCREDENCGDVRELEAPLDPFAHASRMEQLALEVFGHWCKNVIGST